MLDIAGAGKGPGLRGDEHGQGLRGDEYGPSQRGRAPLASVDHLMME